MILRALSITIFIFHSCCAFAQLDQLRILFLKAENNDAIKSFYTSALAVDGGNLAVIQAYKATATAMYAGVAESVSDKISYFNSGKTMLETAVRNDWYNAEIRFLRFCIQAEVPFFLGYNGNLKEDSELIIYAIENNQIEWKNNYWQKAITIMLNSGELKDEQNVKLKKYKLS